MRKGRGSRKANIHKGITHMINETQYKILKEVKRYNDDVNRKIPLRNIIGLMVIL